jgi:hypothetical protein
MGAWNFCSITLHAASPCRTAFNEYQLCVEKRDRKDPLCLQRGRDYSTICPVKWIESYKDALDKGISMSVGKEFFLEKK